MRSLKFKLIILGAVAFALVSCGEPTDDPEDCTDAEFFDLGDKRCKTCPAVEEPECREGCGFAIVQDDRNCPIAECDLVCE